MVQRKDLLSLGFYRLSPFHGSDRALSYRIEKIEEVIGEDDKGKPKKAITGLRVTTYPGPYNFQNTDDSLKETKDFPFEAGDRIDLAVNLDINEFRGSVTLQLVIQDWCRIR